MPTAYHSSELKRATARYQSQADTISILESARYRSRSVDRDRPPRRDDGSADCGCDQGHGHRHIVHPVIQFDVEPRAAQIVFGDGAQHAGLIRTADENLAHEILRAHCFARAHWTQSGQAGRLAIRRILARLYM